jgi:TolB-like protein/DNA-binding winged helix-turn-helix (wHTH) protein
VLATAGIFEFEEFRLDRQGEGLSRRDEHGVFVPLSIGPRALDVLSVLVQRAGELVSKEEIMAAVWRRSVVENANLTVQISTLRRVLDQGRPEGSCIQTVAARGYRFLPAVTRVGEADERRETRGLRQTRSGNGAPNPAAIDAQERPSETVGLPVSRNRQRRLALAGFALTIATLMLAGAAVWWTRLASPPASMTENAPALRSLSAPRLSIVVLPFADLSEGGGQQYFADGITDDLTTDLSRLAGVFVIARNTAFTYKDKQIDAKQIGRELGVRYMLEGSVRRSGNQVRVNAQLVDAESGAHLWAERFDHEIGDLFALQNEITSRIANTLGWELIGAETARPTDRPDALDYLLRGRAVMGGGGPRENTDKAVDLFEHALALDPRSAEA